MHDIRQKEPVTNDKLTCKIITLTTGRAHFKSLFIYYNEKKIGLFIFVTLS